MDLFLPGLCSGWGQKQGLAHCRRPGEERGRDQEPETHRIISFIGVPAGLFEQGTIKTSAIKTSALPWLQNVLRVRALSLLPSACPQVGHDSHPFCPTVRPTDPAPHPGELQLLPALNPYCLDLIHVLLFQLALHPPHNKGWAVPPLCCHPFPPPGWSFPGEHPHEHMFSITLYF